MKTMKKVYWTIRKAASGFDLSVCFDSDSDGILTGHDWVGNFQTIQAAAEAAFHDGLSAPELVTSAELLAMSADDRILASAARVECELAIADESMISYPLTQNNEAAQ
jgi:hypothetical protein